VGFLQEAGRSCVFSGVRPSSGAEMLEKTEGAFEMSDTLERNEVAAAEDGRTPAIGEPNIRVPISFLEICIFQRP